MGLGLSFSTISLRRKKTKDFALKVFEHTFFFPAYGSRLLMIDELNIYLTAGEGEEGDFLSFCFPPRIFPP